VLADHEVEGGVHERHPLGVSLHEREGESGTALQRKRSLELFR